MTSAWCGTVDHGGGEDSHRLSVRLWFGAAVLVIRVSDSFELNQ